nr:hypothetical protein [Tanacetum cinerariifolium]GEZ43897.1 hypothetical protein [Tanacetum cinerariifolium]
WSCGVGGVVMDDGVAEDGVSEDNQMEPTRVSTLASHPGSQSDSRMKGKMKEDEGMFSYS